MNCDSGVFKSIGIEKIDTSFQETSVSLTFFLLHLDMIYSFFLFLQLYSDCATETVCDLKCLQISSMDRQVLSV